MKGHDTIIAGEGYAGKYVALYSYDLLNKNLHEGTSLNLVGAFMGDPYIAPLTQRSSMYKVPEALNIIDDSNMD